MTQDGIAEPIVWRMKSSSGARRAHCDVSEQESGDLELRVHVEGQCVYAKVHECLESITEDAKRVAARMRRQGWVFDDAESS